jgi:NADP-reducing hydrogenase subunit HndD
MKIVINREQYDLPAGQTILDACFSVGIEIPTLCYERSIGAISSCRVCVVEVVGRRGLVTACNTDITEGMQIVTNSERVIKARKAVAELLLSDHKLKCMSCERVDDCRLRKVAVMLRADKSMFAKDKDFADSVVSGDNGTCPPVPDTHSVCKCPSAGKSCIACSSAGKPCASRPIPAPCSRPSCGVRRIGSAYIKRDNAKCINCGRCIRVCKNFQAVGVLGMNGRGFPAEVGCAFGKGLDSTACVSCGQCVANCPTGALIEVSNLEELRNKLNDKDTHCVIATAPSTRVAIGEGFGLPSGTNVQGKMVASLKKIGFDKVFDLDLGADFTIMEEGAELLERVRTGKNLPQFTSCCPAWVNYVEAVHPELIPNMSAAKSPMGMFAALVKTYYAEKQNIDPKKIYCVMLMPCIAKMSEIARDGVKDVDLILTTRTAIRFIKEQGIDFEHLEDMPYDDPLSMSSGAGLIFGTTGGVAEAALRSVGGKMPREIKTVVVSGLANAEKVIQDIKAGRADYDFIEVMACPGGCVNGGGQPSHTGEIQDNRGNAALRSKTLYNMDKYHSLRKSDDNPTIKKIYAEFLGTPGSPLARKLLHTKFKRR